MPGHRSPPLDVTVICGSVRPGSLTKSAMRILVAELEAKKAQVEVIDPHGIQVGALGAPLPAEIVSAMKASIARADGLILCTPEYNGCFSSVLLAIIENLGYPSLLKGKPISLLGVASGSIGAIKALEHLRSVCAHLGALVLPWAASIAGIHERFNAQGECSDEKTLQLIRSVAKEHLQFLQTARV